MPRPDDLTRRGRPLGGLLRAATVLMLGGLAWRMVSARQAAPPARLGMRPAPAEGSSRSASQAAPAEAETEHGGQEPIGVSIRQVVLLGAGMFALVALALGGVAGLFALRAPPMETGQSMGSPVRGPAPVAGPQLQVVPKEDLNRLRQAESERLGPKAAIPIERAMDLVSERHGQAFDPLPGALTGGTPAPATASPAPKGSR